MTTMPSCCRPAPVRRLGATRRIATRFPLGEDTHGPERPPGRLNGYLRYALTGGTHHPTDKLSLVKVLRIVRPYIGFVRDMLFDKIV